MNYKGHKSQVTSHKLLLYLCACVLVLLCSGEGAFTETFNQSVVKGGVGIRPLSMGGAFTAVADDVNAIYYNPAGLAGQLFSLSAANYNLNKPNNNSGSSGFFNAGSLGYGWWGASTPTGEAVSVGSLAYAEKAANGFNWGLSYKKVNSRAGGTWSSDIGFLLRITSWLNLGFLAQDFVRNGDMIVDGSSRLGVAIIPPDQGLILAADIEYDADRNGENLTHYGLEYSALGGLKLRFGSDKGKTTYGLGFVLPFMTIDYAFISDPNSLEYQQRAGISLAVPNPAERSFSIIKEKEFALIEVRSDMVSGMSQASILGGFKPGLDDVVLHIRKAAKDPSIDGILLKIGSFNRGLGGLAMAQELRTELKAAKKQGKKIVVYIEDSAWGEEYYLAAGADKIIVPQGASIGGLGKMIAIPRAADLFDKIGIDWEEWSTGDYKDTFSPFRKKLSPKQKEMVEGLVADLYRQMITDISLDRAVAIEKMKKIGDGRLLTASEAKEMGLIDEIGYLNDAARVAGELCGGEEEAKLIPPHLVAQDLPGEYLFSVFNRIAVINVNGEIVTGKSGQNLLFGGVAVGSDTITGQVRKATDDKQIKAIILRVNSGGGSAIAAAQIYEEIKRARKKGKIVIASMGNMAASGGYFVSAGADKIVADPATITGSIGVIGYFPVLEKLYKMLGIEMEVVKEGEHTDMFSGNRKLTKEEKDSIRRLMEENYQHFIASVAEGRGLSKEEVEKRAGGKIYTGKQALEEGLVDELGGFTDAIETAKQMAGIRGEAQLFFYDKEEFSLFPWQNQGK